MTAPQLSQRPAAGFGAVQRWKGRLTVGIGLLLGSYLLLIGNLIAFRHPWRIDLTTEGLYTLSRETLDRLKLVHEEIEVVIPTLLLRDNPEHAAVQEVLRRARATLNEISSAQPLVRADSTWAGLRADIGKSIETEFHDLSSNGWVLRLEHVAQKWSRF